MNYKIAFCGLGSIAKRHLMNVCTFLKKGADTCEIDLYRSSIKPLPDEIQPLIKEEFLFSAPILKDYDVVFVTNPTSLHYETLKIFKDHTKSFFIEKPIFDKTDIEESFFNEMRGIVCYVACPLRYNPVLQYVKEHINLKVVLSARAISSSYLPEWRPGQDYRKCYSAHRDMGGGVSIDLIHEWDYLTWLFGMPTECHQIISKVSNLEIDSDDLAIYIGRNKNITIELHLDYFGRKEQRTLDIFAENDTIHCDFISGTVSYLKQDKTVKLDNLRNAYQMKEIEHFFGIINNKIDNDSTPEHAYRVLKIAKGEL